MTEKLDVSGKAFQTLDKSRDILRIRLSEKILAGAAEIQGEACIIIQNEPEGPIFVFRIEDVETLCEVYAEHCMPAEEGHYQ